jgi:transcriptional regulator with XRE-family HTH domain
MDWPTYLAEISTNHSEIARAADVHSGTVGRWFKGTSRPEASAVIAVARAFDRSPVVALVVAGYLTRDEIEGSVQITPGMSLAEFTELEIAQELVRRIEAGETTEISEQPINVSTGPWEYHHSDVSGQTEHEREVNLTLEVILNSHEVELRDRDGRHVYNDVDDAFKAIRNRMMHDYSNIEALPHAALTKAREVEEDQHTP